MCRRTSPTAVSAKPQQSITGSPRIRVKIKAPTQFRETVFLTGGAPELGEWNVDRGVPLRWTPGHVWHGQIELHCSQTEIKFVRKHELQPIADWQGGANIRRFQTFVTAKKKV